MRRKQTFNTRGWITHAENGVFGGSTWKWSKGDAAWVAQNLWDHYAFTQDKEYLRDACLSDHEGAVRVLGGSSEGTARRHARFARRLLAGTRPARGRRFVRPATGVGPVHQLHRSLRGTWASTRRSARRSTAMRERLLGPQIGSWGQLQEWMVDRDDPKDQHRHLSHMIAVHPGSADLAADHARTGRGGAGVDERPR